MNLENFKKLGLSEKTVKELQRKGFEEPTEIQEKTIPVFLGQDVDIIGQAQTGTGKTAAFGLPLIELISKTTPKVQALILVPTRELAIQVSEELNSFKGSGKQRIAPIYGGQSYTDQLRRLKEGLEIVVGTPGRINDHIKRKTLDLSQVAYLILDEADEMLNMGFIDEVETIMASVNPNRRTLLFSATMSDRVADIARKHMKNPLSIEIKKNQLTVELTDQIYFEVRPTDRFEALCRIIDIELEFYGLIFCRTKVDVDELTNRLIDRGYAAEGIHGDLSQHQRERVLEKFRKKRTTILAATDVAARGIDINDLTHVINYALPQDPEAYVHRIGRTGRAHKKGIAITFISPAEYRKLMIISKTTKSSIRKEKVPQASEIINIKKARMKTELIDIIKSGIHEDFRDMAAGLLEGVNPEDALAALLKYTLEDEFSQSRYRDINEVSVDFRGTSRLFVAMGHKDGFTPKKLVKLIQNASNIQASRINDVTIKDSYSFITVPFEDAEKVLKAFEKRKVDSQPVVRLAGDEPKSAGKKKSFADKKPYAGKKSFSGEKTYGDKKPYAGKKTYGDKKPYKKSE